MPRGRTRDRGRGRGVRDPSPQRERSRSPPSPPRHPRRARAQAPANMMDLMMDLIQTQSNRINDIINRLPAAAGSALAAAQNATQPITQGASLPADLGTPQADIQTITHEPQPVTDDNQVQVGAQASTGSSAQPLYQFGDRPIAPPFLAQNIPAPEQPVNYRQFYQPAGPQYAPHYQYPVPAYQQQHHMDPVQQAITQPAMAMAIPTLNNEGEDDTQICAPLLTLGAFVEDKTKALIWEKRYVILGSLSMETPTSPALAVSWGTDKTAFSLTPPKAALPETFDEWQDLFHTYAAIYTEVHTAEAPALFTYSIRIKELSNRYPGYAWRTYDMNFRKLKARQPSLPWQRISMEVLVPLLEILKNKPSENSQGNNNRDKQPFCALGGTPPKDTCTKYYYRGVCDKDQCKFNHLCGHCKRHGHPLQDCRQFKNRNNKGKKRPSTNSSDTSKR